MTSTTARVTAFVLTLAVLVGGCDSEGGRAAAPKPVSDIYFRDSLSLRIPVEKSETGFRATDVALAGQLLMNERSDTIRVTDLEPVAESGMRVTYLGHTTCDRGCPGAIGGKHEAFFVDRLEGRYPIEVAPNKRDATLVFRLEADGAQGAEHLVKHCYLHVWHIILTLDSGEKIQVGFDGDGEDDWLTRLHLGGPPFPEGTSPECRSA